TTVLITIKDQITGLGKGSTDLSNNAVINRLVYATLPSTLSLPFFLQHIAYSLFNIIFSAYRNILFSKHSFLIKGPTELYQYNFRLELLILKLNL
uniref:hypothetical protein n=1 Tax=uncultured Vibrio sp. TaxID=114054 RepID=UPI0026233B52